MASETKGPLEKSSEDVTTVRTRGDPRTEPGAARTVHGPVLVGAMYLQVVRAQISQIIKGSQLRDSIMVYIEEMATQMAPRDPFEEMLVAQAMLTHIRVLSLTQRAVQATEAEQLRILNDYADRASNTYRRLMLAMKDYRRPAGGLQRLEMVSGMHATNEQGLTPWMGCPTTGRATSRRCRRRRVDRSDAIA
jgi:hypothetical protein